MFNRNRKKHPKHPVIWTKKDQKKYEKTKRELEEILDEMRKLVAK